MGLFDTLKNLFASAHSPYLSADAPSEEFPQPTDAMEHLISRIPENGWATFVVRDGGRELIIQVVGDGINTCLERVDVPAIARQIGLPALADAIEAERAKTNDPTLHRASDATPREIAEVVHGIFVHHYRVPADYRVMCSLES